jgi:hypothetical protein
MQKLKRKINTKRKVLPAANSGFMKWQNKCKIDKFFPQEIIS